MARENADPDNTPLEKPVYHVPTKKFKENYPKIDWTNGGTREPKGKHEKNK